MQTSFSGTVRRLLGGCLAVGAVGSMFNLRVLAADGPTSSRPETQPADRLVSLNLPENAPLKVLIEYVGQEFGFNIFYDDLVGNQRLTIKAPAKLPRSSVPALLESALRLKGMALVDGDQP